ncbi:MAG: hypothetical protein ACJAS2_000752 [Pseudohongiellaceae bacterium]|jgi:hypothetical protein
MLLQESLKEPLCGLSISPLLQEYINHLTILINGSPQVMLLTMDRHEDFIIEERISISLMFSSQPLSILRPELVAP